MKDAGELMQCELLVYLPSATGVALTGSFIDGASRIIMSQSAFGQWIARLWLTPGSHTVRIHVSGEKTALPRLESSGRCWEAAFVVPKTIRAGNADTHLRIWLHEQSHSVNPGQTATNEQ